MLLLMYSALFRAPPCHLVLFVDANVLTSCMTLVNRHETKDQQSGLMYPCFALSDIDILSRYFKCFDSCGASSRLVANIEDHNDDGKRASTTRTTTTIGRRASTMWTTTLATRAATRTPRVDSVFPSGMV